MPAPLRLHLLGELRVTRDGEPPIRSFFARMFYKLINRISEADIVDGARDFRLMKREMVDAIVSMCEYNRFSKGIFGWIGFKTKWLPYKNVERVAGETKWSFFKLFKYSLDGIVNFSQAPLSIASVSGLILTAIAFFMILFVVIRRLIFGDPVAGWASTVCIILFIGGVQLLFQFCHHLIGYGALEGTLQPFGLLCLAEALDLAAEIGSSTGHPPGGVYMDLALRGMDNAYQLFFGEMLAAAGAHSYGDLLLLHCGCLLSL